MVSLKQIFHNKPPKEKETKTKAVKKLKNKTAAVLSKKTQQKNTSIFDLSSGLFNRYVGLGLVSLGLLSFLALLFKQARARKENEFINEAPQQEQAIKFDVPGQETLSDEDAPEEACSVTELNEETDTEGEKNYYPAIDKAKALVDKNAVEEAVEYLKQVIKEEPKSAINIWLYLLVLLRKQNLRVDFEKVAADMHDTFDVMAPLWEKQEVAIEVPESLEAFPHVMEKLTKIWPKKSAKIYLTELVTDNRNGEYVSFGQPVMDEILLLIHVLDKRSGK